MTWETELQARLSRLTCNTAKFTNCFDAGGYIAGDFYLHYNTCKTRIQEYAKLLTDKELLDLIVMPLIDAHIKERVIKEQSKMKPKTRKEAIEMCHGMSHPETFVQALEAFGLLKFEPELIIYIRNKGYPISEIDEALSKVDLKVSVK